MPTHAKQLFFSLNLTPKQEKYLGLMASKIADSWQARDSALSKAQECTTSSPLFFVTQKEYVQCCSRPELLVIRMGSEERQAVE